MSPKAGAATSSRSKSKQPVAKRPAAKVAAPNGTRKAPTRKAPARKPASKSSTAARQTPAARRAAPRKAAPRPTTGRKAPVRKPATRKAPAHRPGVRLAPVRALEAPKVRTAVSPRKRLVALLVIMTVALGLIFFRLLDVQALEGNKYRAMAEAQRVRSVTLAAERGSIFDRNGNDLALSVPQHTIWADPRVIKEPARYANKLAPIVDVDTADLRDRLEQKDTAFVYVARKVSDEAAAKVKALNLPGVGDAPESKRFYPGQGLAGPLLGFVGTDNNGLGGLEAKYENTLRGKPGKIVAEEDPNGREIPATQRIDDPARRGGDLVLTLDQSLQYEVEKQLVAQVNSVKARGGIAIVADVKTGDVLAMASVDGGEKEGEARLASADESNRPLTAVYEPGSTAKVVTVGAALEAKVVEPTTPFIVPWKMDIADRTFKDAEEHPDANWNVNDIVRESSNVGVIKIAERLGKERLDAAQRAFGFGSKTAINFPGESAGLMKDVGNYVASDMGSIPIGYTTAVTPMQMLDVFVTVANGGVTRPPRLVDATIGSDGERREVKRQRGHRVISQTTADQLNLMLRAVVADGTGVDAAISGYTVAGKTGTSRKPPYEPTPRYMASFAGFAPAESPRLAAIVVIDQPGTSNEEYFGGKVAAPLFSTIMQYALRMEHVPPTTMMSAEALSSGPAAKYDTPPADDPKTTTVGITTPTTPTTKTGAGTAAAGVGATPAGNLAQPVR